MYHFSISLLFGPGCSAVFGRVLTRAAALKVRLGYLCCAILVGCALGENGASSAFAEPTYDPDPTKRALVVTIGEYAPETGWAPLSSDKDREIMVDLLEAQGFPRAQIATLSNAQATAENIVVAFRQLIQDSKPSDVVAFQFSGHGQRVTDDNGDELDRYDETLVPYDAPEKPVSGYKGERHLRDDQLGRLLFELRQKVGPGGNVVVFIDSCFSGTITRASGALRGSLEPFDVPGAAIPPHRGSDRGSGFHEMPTSRGMPLEDQSLAPYVLFSAAAYNRLAQETMTDDGTPIGSLTYGISSALARAAETRLVTYQDLYDKVKWALQDRVSNEPQIEGDGDREIFARRRVIQQPYVEIEAVQSPRRLTLMAGSIAGLLPDAQVEIHRAGTKVPSPESRIGKGSLTFSTPLRSTVELTADASREELARGRAFITAYSFGDLRIRVQLPPAGGGAFREELDAALRDIPAVELVENAPDVQIEFSKVGVKKPAVSAWDLRTGTDLLADLPSEALTGADPIVNRLQDFARNRYLRGLRDTSPEADVAFEIVPVEIERCIDERITLDTCTFKQLDIGAFLSEGGNLVLPVGSWFQLRIHPGQTAQYFSILELMPNGTINLLWPPPEQPERTLLAASSKPMVLNAAYQVDKEPLGWDVLQLVASETYIDFRPFASTDWARARARAARRGANPNLGPLAPLFDDAAVRTRANPTYGQGSIGVYVIDVTIVP